MSALFSAASDAVFERMTPEGAARQEWRDLFDRARFRDPYPCSPVPPHDLLPARQREWIDGWVCPSCGDVEWNGFLLSLNHGWDPDRPGHFACEWAVDFTLCYKQRHLAQRQPMPGDPSGRWSWDEQRIVGDVYVSPTPGKPIHEYGPNHPSRR